MVGYLLRIDYEHISKQIDERLYFEITSACNLSCIHCSSLPINEGSILTSNEITQIVKDMVKLGIKNVVITGGEPFLRGDCIDILYNISKICTTLITTNGLNLPFLWRVHGAVPGWRPYT